MPELRERLGAALGGAYRLERELGGGGMGRVFLAEEARLGRRVVIKVLPPEMAAGVSIARFEREIQLAARLQHPLIVPLLAAGSSGDLLYYTMPFIEGESLRGKLAREGELPVPEALRILRDVAEALAYAHRQGVVHRDIKPDNVLLSEGHGLVTDFGVAKAVAESTGAHAITSMGLALGTPLYMAPEQAAASPGLDHRADIYAVGILAYEMLCGRTPFSGPTPQAVLAAHVAQAPQPCTTHRPALPPELNELVMRCLEKHPADRWQRAEGLQSAVEAMLTPMAGTTPVRAQSAGAGGAARWKRLGWRTWAAIGLAGVVGGALVVRAVRHRAASSPLEPRRVVVATFQNKTGDATLDPLAAMAADWIARGLAGTGLVDVAGTAAELASRAGVTVQPGPSAVKQLGLEARAGIVISGAFYKEGDSLLFQADFTDVEHGRLLQAVGPASAPAARPLDAIEELRQRVTGSLAPYVDPSLAELAHVTAKPPSYDAYREFLRGEELYYQDEAAALGPYLRAAALDSAYQYPLLRAVGVLANQRRLREADSLAHAVGRRGGLLTEFERAYLDYLDGQIHGDYAAEEEGLHRMSLAAPRSEFVGYFQAVTLTHSGDPRGAAELFQRLDPESGILRGRLYYYGDYALALHALGQYDRALDVARSGRRRYPERLYLTGVEAPALAVLGRSDELVALLDSISWRQPDLKVAPLGIAASALWEAEAHGQVRTAERVRQWLGAHLAADGSHESRDAVMLGGRAHALAALHEWARLESVADSLTADEPHRTPALGLLGLAAAELGDSARALAADSLLADAQRDPYGTEDIKAARALIAAALGDRERAMVLLRSLSARGWAASLWHRGLGDIFGTEGTLFELMRGYPPFEELLVARR